MIKLTRETIDNIFMPRRKVSFDTAPVYRLLMDAKGNYYHVAKHRRYARGARPGENIYEWFRLSHRAPDYGPDQYSTRWRYRAKTYPTWVPVDNSALASIARDLFEVLPAPIHQMQILEAFYRIALPNWDSIVKIDQWPRVSETTWKYIWNLFAAFDERMHPDVVRGGAWALGSGFSNAGHDSDRDSVPDWMIDISPCRIAYAWTPYWFTIKRTDYGDNNEYHSFYPVIHWENEMRAGIERGETGGRRYDFETAAADCEAHAKQKLTWTEETKQADDQWDAMWRSQTITPEVKQNAA